MFAPVAAPVPLAIRGPFTAVTIDAQRRRVLAAGALSVAVIDADTGKLLATVRIGDVRSLALEPLGGHVFAGTRDGRISEIDPDRKTVLRSVDAAGATEALLFDAATGRLYGAGAGRPAVSVFDSRSFASAAPLKTAGGVPAQLVPDPVTHELYIGFADRPEIAIADPARGTVRASFDMPGLPSNNVLRLDDALGQLAAAGGNGTLNVYDRAGTRRWHLDLPAGITGCDLNVARHVFACAGAAGLTFVQLLREAEPVLIGTAALAAPALLAFDSKTNDAVVIRSRPDGSGAAVERWSASPNPTASAR